jgi:hypothetical protein
MIVSENRQLDCYLHRLHPRYDLLFLFDVSPVSCEDIPQPTVVIVVVVVVVVAVGVKVPVVGGDFVLCGDRVTVVGGALSGEKGSWDNLQACRYICEEPKSTSENYTWTLEYS